MIVDFKNKKLTDDTSEMSKSDLFLLTERNEVYFNNLDKKIDFIRVKDLIKEWGLEEIKFIGITGTNGKTTVAAAIAHGLNKLGYGVANQGTSGLFLDGKKITEKNRTTPEILETLYNAKLAKEKGIEFFVMEVSSHAIAQNRIENINFDVKVHTNITSDHLDFHKTIEKYRNIKNSFLSDESIKVINIDDPFVRFNKKNSVTYSWNNPKSDYQIANLNLKTLLVGKFNLYNLTAAIIVIQKLLQKISLEQVTKIFEDFNGVVGRMEVISRNPLIIVDFAHTDDGMEKVLSSFPNKKLVVVFGAGGDRDISKRSKMGFVAEKYAQRIYITSDNPRTENPERIIDQILEGVKDRKKVETILDRKKAIQKAVNNLKEDEILFVLGKGDETYQEINNRKIPFDDREIIRDMLK